MSEDQEAYDAGTGASHRLFRETQAAKVLRAQMADIIGDDAEFAADLVEGETNLIEAIDLAVRAMFEDYVLVNGLEEMIKKLTARKDRLEARIDNTRTALCVALEQAGRTKYEHDLVTISLKSKPVCLVVTDEALVPSKFWKASDPRLDKKALLGALKAKEEVSGVHLSNGGVVLQVRIS